MTLENLDNLVKIGELKKEDLDKTQFGEMLESAKVRVKDIKADGLSVDGKFLSAYGAAHILALAAMLLAWVSIFESLSGVSMFTTYGRTGRL